jgi:nitrogen-specific signal transduction histidine kinase
VRVLGTAVDIQDRRTLEEQLRQAQKMEAIGRLAGGVAHDFNNLLTVIGTNTAYLAETLEGEGAIDVELTREVLAEVSAASDRAARLTAQLLAFGRKSPQKLESIEPTTLVRGLSTMLRRLLGESVELSLGIAPGLGLVRADSSQLEQVLMNLCINARDAMPNGGVVSIRVRRVVLAAGPRIAFEVRDRGVGMDSVTRARAFEPFYTTKPPGRGTGLGLSVALGIIQQSGGTIEIDSEVGQGTTVRVLLPELEPTPAALPTRPEPAAPPAQATSHGASILVVEDEPAVARLVKRTLESRGHSVLVAGDADDAQALLARLGPSLRLDLLVTDLRLPGRSGRALAEALRAERPDLPVIFISGYHDEGELSFLQKPFHPQALLTLVDTALAERATRESGLS